MILPAHDESGHTHTVLRLHGPNHVEPATEQLAPELWRALRTRRSLIVGCATACLLLAGLYIILRNPRYEASARIEVSPTGTNSIGLEDLTAKMLSPFDSNVQLQSAATILQSKTVALAVLQQEKLAERKDFAGRWMQPPGAQISELSPEVRDQLLLRFQKNLKVDIVPKTDIINVQFRAKDPKLAADVVNATISSYMERNFHSSYDSASQVSQWLSKQMGDLKLKANDAQEKLAAMQKQRGLIGVDETDNIVTDKLKELDEQLTTVESDRIVKEARYRIAGSGNPELIASTVPEPTLQVLRSQQAQLRVDYARLSTKFGEGYPKLAELGNQMAQVDAAINSELKNLSERYKNEYLAAGAAEKMLHADFEAQKQKAFDLNQGAAQYAILKHEVEATQDLYETLQLKLQQAGIMAGLASANIGIVEPGQVPSEPVDPRPLADLAIALGGGLVLGILWASGLEALDTTIRTGEEAEMVSQLPTLALIPEARPDKRSWQRNKSLPPESPVNLCLIAHQQPQSPIAEAYRGLRTALLLQSNSAAPAVLCVTSSMPSEGKTLTAINCAVVLAQQGAKVLLVDADLRQSSLHRVFGIPVAPGLSELLSGVASSDQAIASCDLLPHLSLLPSGTACASPAEKLASPHMRELLEQWRSHYDHIVFDTPPVSLFTDAVILSARSDAVLLIARAGATTRYSLRHSRDLLQRSNANIAGVVLNGIDRRYESSHYHRYGYGFGGGNALVH